MKLTKDNNIEQDEIGIQEEIEAGIAKENIPLVFKMATENLYSNPIGSIVREITSNVYDANVESNSTEPLIIKFERNIEDDTKYIIFKDNGLGMSPDRIETIYMSLFNSTKRDNDDEIGGWGLGSKTPLSYQDLFYITTVYENVEYQYMLYKTDTLPMLNKLSENPTTKKSGTEIKVEINKNDEYKFHLEFKQQLSYFDNVFIDTNNNWSYYHNNNYEIIEGKTFKYKNTERPYEQLHICLGQVTYKIDWKALKRKPIDVGLALKFDIGDLPVVISREDIRYTEKSIETINKKIDDMLIELTVMYQNQSEPITNFKDYYLKKGKIRNLKLTEHIELNSEALGFKSNYVLEGHENLLLPYDYDLFYNYEIILIEKGNVRKRSRGLNNLKILDSKLVVLKSDESFDKWNNIKLYNGIILKEKNKKVRYSSNNFDVDYSNYNIPSSFKDMIETDELGNKKIVIDNFYTRLYYKAKNNIVSINTYYRKIKEFNDVLSEYLYSVATPYYTATKEWIKEYKELYKSEDLSKIRKLEGKILIYNVYGIRQEVEFEKLAKYKYVFYKVTDEKHINLQVYKHLLSKHSLSVNEKIYFLGISRTKLKELNKLNNVHHVNGLLLNTKFGELAKFRNYLVKVNLADRLNEKLDFYNNFQLEEYSPYYCGFQTEIEKFVKKWHIDFKNNYFAKPDLSKFINTKNYDIKSKAFELKKFLEKVDILRYLYDSMPIEYRIKIIKACTKTTKLNPKYYKK